MAFGGDADAAEAARMYRAGRDAGINFFDTADQYNAGKSEEILGELIRGQRDELVIATKCFNPTGSGVNARGANRRHVRSLEDVVRSGKALYAAVSNYSA
jgi:aryl-alcohol dehydrogenase-like predicted oxidoreductase